jgi:endonuclease YncB( thermonuclease family)
MAALARHRLRCASRALGLLAATLVLILSGIAPRSSSGDPAAREVRARVVQVVDGRTLRIEFADGERRIGLIGVYTPSIDPARCGSHAAKRSLAQLVARRVTVTPDPGYDDPDQRRQVAYVESAGRDMSRAQLRRGWADWLPGSYARSDTYREAKRAARDGDKGVWRFCGGDFDREPSQSRARD